MTSQELLERIQALIEVPNAAAFRELVENTPYADLAEALEEQPVDGVAALLLTLSPDDRADLVAYLRPDRQDALVMTWPAKIVVKLFERLPADDRADMFNRMDDEAKAKLLPALDKAEREDILRLAAYSEGSVGSETTSDYAAVKAEMTVATALQSLRRSAIDSETIYVIYVLNDARQLLGTLSLRDLVLADPTTKVADLMVQDPVFARAEWPKSEAVELIRRYSLLALPVIDSGHRMIGIVTVDDAMDIELKQEAAKLTRFGGTGALGGPDLDLHESSFRQMFSMRFVWLAMLTFFGVITSTYVAHQEEILSEVIILAAFIAPIIDMGGNTGSQSATLVIRGMALGQVRLRLRDVMFVVRKELPLAATLGISIAILEAVLAYFSKGVGVEVLMVVGLSMLTVTVLGGVIGGMLPFFARRIGTDPATLSSPMITSIMDLLGVFIYFAFAYAFLGHLLEAAV